MWKNKFVAFSVHITSHPVPIAHIHQYNDVKAVLFFIKLREHNTQNTTAALAPR